MFRLKACSAPQIRFSACGAALFFAAVFGSAYLFQASAARGRASAEGLETAAATMTPTNKPLIAARRGHTATLLADGRVLVAGGLDANDNALASAEIYDPATGEWRAAKAMNQQRYRHTAVLLRDGRVLVAGGIKNNVLNGANATNSVEIYDPVADTWTNAASLLTARYSHTASLFGNGQVIVTGGDGLFGVLRKTEIFDGTKWTPAGDLLMGRSGHAAVVLSNGHVLVAGGRTNLLPLSSSEIFDPSLGTWRRAGNLSNARRLHSLTLLADGNVLAVGGLNASGALKSSEIFDKGKLIWSKTIGDLLTARYSHTATLLPSGLVFVCGGVGTNTLTSSELYDPGRRSWTSTSTLRNARSEHTATILHSGQILIAAGGNDSSKSINSSELYENTNAQWAATKDAGGTQTQMAFSRFAHTATMMGNGRVLVTGGRGVAVAGGIATQKTAEVYHPFTQKWERTGGDMSLARESHTATLLVNGKVLIAGGQNGNTFHDTAELYDPATGLFTAAGQMSEARAFHTATLMPDGRVLVTGGRNASAVHASGDIYNPTTNTWSKIATALTAPRREHTATLLPNNRILIVGGRNLDDQFHATIDIINPANGQVTHSAYTMPAPRAFHTATLLTNGDVLIVGGLASTTQVLRTAEIYEVAADRAAPVQDMKSQRRYHTATLLVGGKVLAAGGVGPQNVPIATCELFDPATGQWEQTADLSLGARSVFTATLLPGGNVLATGGLSGSENLASSYRRSSERYDVGLDFGESVRPALLAVNWSAAGVVSTSGLRFRGLSESSGGQTQNSASDYPVVQLRSLANDQTRFLQVDPASGWSNFSSISLPATGLPPGYVMVTVFTNGIPSLSKPVRNGASLDASEFASISGRIATRNGVGFPATLLVTSSTQEQILPIVTDANGYFSFPNLKAKAFRDNNTQFPIPIVYTITIQQQPNVKFNPQSAQFTTNITSPNTFSQRAAPAAEPEQEGTNVFSFNSTATGAVWNIGGFVNCGSGTTKVTIQSEGVTESQNVPCANPAAAYLFTELPDGDAYTITAATAPASSPTYVFAPDSQMWTLNGASVTNLNFIASSGNPVPALTTLSPMSQQAGSSTFLMTVNGSNFIADSHVMWNGSQRETQYVNANQLTAEILQSDIASPGIASVTVNNPVPGGGTSNALNFTAPATPSATTNAATNLTTTAATLNASVTPNASATTAYFEWKTTSDLNVSPNVTSAQMLGSGAAALPVAANLTGLSAGTTYYFRIASQNSIGTARGATLSFATQIACPTVSNLSATSAMPGADVMITGTNFTGVTSVQFNGTSATFTVANDTTINATVPAGATTGPVSVSKSGCGNATSGNFTVLPSYEADVTPRPTGSGDGNVTVADWVRIGIFIANPGMATAGSEFQRADCAPLGTFGDGQLTMSDWVQAGRYAAALDPVVAAAGPTTTSSFHLPSMPIRNPQSAIRNALESPTVRLTTSRAGKVVRASVYLDATGDENAVGFSLAFDRAKWRAVTVDRVDDSANATINTSNLKSDENSLGIAVALNPGQTWQAGERLIVVISFAPVGQDAGALDELAFADFPTAREVVSVKAAAIPARFKVNGVDQITVVSAPESAQVELRPGETAIACFDEAAGTQRRLPPPTRATGWQIIVRDSRGAEHRAQLYDVSSGQIRFQIPLETGAGVATVFIKSDSGQLALGTIVIK